MIPRSNKLVKFLYYVKVDLCINKGSPAYWKNVRTFCQGIERTSSTTQNQDTKTTPQKDVEPKAVEMIKEAVTKDTVKDAEGSIRSKLEKLVTNTVRSVQEKKDLEDNNDSSETLSSKLKRMAAANTEAKQLIKDNKSERREQYRKIKQGKNDQINQAKLEKDKEMVKEKPKKAVKKRARVDLSATSMERNFVTPARAMTDFLLKPDDLKDLKATKRRSPYENEPPITVYWRKDVEAKAIDVWGSTENFQKEKLKKELERRLYEQNIFTNKRRLRDYRRERNSQDMLTSDSAGLFGTSGKVVLTAIAINGSNFLFKLFAWLYTGSHSMFSESIHSLADTINQLILAFGIHKSVQKADPDHPYGYANMKYVASLISGVGIFCVGAGLSIYHGVIGLMHPTASEPFFWAFCILGGSLVSEGATLLVAINSIKKGACKKKMTFAEYVFRGQDPSVNVVLLEDMAAVLGVTVAGGCMALTAIYDSHVPDAVGSIVIGGLLAAVASFIIYTNVAALVGRSIPQELLDRINAELESDVMIRAIYDVKGIDMGNCLVRYKAELDFDGRQLAKSYLDNQDMGTLLKEVQQFQNIDELEPFILKHSEKIIDMIGGEIDRIEVKLRKKFPEIRHCDLEIL